MIRIRSLPFLSLTVACATFTLVVVACSNSSEGQASFPGDDPDSSPAANLPEAAAPGDAGAAPDAAKDAKPPFDPADEPVICTANPCAVQLAAGEFHVCARMSDGTARCWGDDSKGALGGGDPSDAGAGDAGDGGDAGFVVGSVVGLGGITQLSAGGTTTCARLGDGGVQCWGGNNKGQLGLQASPAAALSDGNAHRTPAPVAITGSATRVDVGQESLCALLASGELWCWGNNAQRQLARSETAAIGGPGAASLGGLTVTRVVAGTDTVFGVTDKGDVVSWGGVAGLEGRLAARIAALSPDALPLSIELGPVSSLSASSTTRYRPPGNTFPRPAEQALAHACAVVKGEVHCWGGSNAGALATGLPDPSIKPTVTLVESERAYPQQVAAGGEITCARLTDGTVQCAGDDTRGALARGREGTFSMFFTPAIAFKGHAVQVAITKTSVCALVQGGTVECWGSNERGELGQGTTDTNAHPTPVKIGF